MATADRSAVCAFDGNGNLGQLVDTSDGTLLARYEYDPYGREIRATGTLADWNRIRFSTKYLDPETDLYYYGYRFYSPGLGRWQRRDPLGEEASPALYGFLVNAPSCGHDPLGLHTIVLPWPIELIQPKPIFPPGFFDPVIGPPFSGARPVPVDWMEPQPIALPKEGSSCRDRSEEDEDAGPWGRCTKQQHHDLHDAYKRTCQEKFNCRRVFECGQAVSRYWKARACYRDRLSFDETCFPSKAPSQPTVDAGRAVNSCVGKIKALCPGGRIPIWGT